MVISNCSFPTENLSYNWSIQSFWEGIWRYLPNTAENMNKIIPKFEYYV